MNFLCYYTISWKTNSLLVTENYLIWMHFPKYGDCKLINLGHMMLFLSGTVKTNNKYLIT